MTPEEEAAELLPCLNDPGMPATSNCSIFHPSKTQHDSDCPASFRPAVAERLRQRDDYKRAFEASERRVLSLEQQNDSQVRLRDERIAALEAENERLRWRPWLCTEDHERIAALEAEAAKQRQECNKALDIMQAENERLRARIREYETDGGTLEKP